MNSDSNSEAEASLGTAIKQSLEGGVLSNPNARWRDIDLALEPVAAAVFNLAAEGRAPEVGPILTRLGMTGQAREQAARTFEREIEAGETKRRVFTGGGLLILSDAAVRAVAGRAKWIPFERYHEDDARPEGNSMTVWEMSKHLARRSRAVFGHPMTAAEVAWATLMGYSVAGILVTRDAWTSAFEGAQSGIKESRAETLHREIDEDRASDRVANLFEGATA